MVESTIVRQRCRQSINFDVPQLLIVKKEQDFVVLSSGISTEGSFKGTVVFSNTKYKIVGKPSEHWDKSQFELFEGEISIKQ